MKPLLSSYRYGSPRKPGEGLRIGAARQVPRGVKREDWQSENYFDVRVPLLAPTLDLVSKFRNKKMTFAAFSRSYQAQMKSPESRQAIELVATISLFQPVSVGCFCEDESRCHRSVLRQLILKEAKKRTRGFLDLMEEEHSVRSCLASPVCYEQFRE